MRTYIFLILFLGLSLCSHAQEVADTIVLSEVTVTHSKAPLSLRKTAKPISVISQQVIQQNLGKDLAQVLNEQAGVVVNGAFSTPGKDRNIYLRGANPDNTLILLDGQPLYDPSGIGGAFDLRLIPLEQVERIEILKGSQSTLYGSDAIGGVINIITNKSADQTFRLNGNVGYGSWNTLKGNIAASGQVDNFDYLVSLGIHQTDGFSEAENNDPNVDFDDDGFSLFNTQAKVGYRFSDVLRVESFVRYNDYDGDFDDGAFADAPNEYTASVLNTGLSLQYQKDALQVTANGTVTNTDRTFISSFGVSPFEGRFNNLDLWANYDFTENLRALVGLNYQNNQILDDSGIEVDPSENIFSPYLSLLYSQNSKFSLEAGLRYNSHSTFGSNLNTSLAAAYWLSEDIKGFSNFTTGFKAPLLSQLYGAFGANPDLDPQTSQSFELGLQYGNMVDQFFARLTYFNRSIEDIIVFDFNIGYFNQNQQDDSGLELEMGLKVNDQLAFNATYSYLTGEQTTIDPNGEEAQSNNLIRRPPHRFGLGARYQLSEKWLINAQLQYLEERDDLFFNPANFFAAENVILDAYYLLNIYTEYRIVDPGLIIFVDAKNLTDQSFNEVYGFTGAGINFLAGIRFQL